MGGVGHDIWVGVALVGHAHEMGAGGCNLVGHRLLVESGTVEHGLGTLWEVGGLGDIGGGGNVVGSPIVVITGRGVGGRG